MKSEKVIKPEHKDFFERVYEIVRAIPPGCVTTYGEIGSALGLRSSARMVGWALNAIAGTYFEESGGININDIPAHRVVNRNGELSGKMYFATPTLMKELLIAEGIEFIGEAVDMRKHLWKPAVQ